MAGHCVKESWEKRQPNKSRVRRTVPLGKRCGTCPTDNRKFTAANESAGDTAQHRTSAAPCRREKIIDKNVRAPRTWPQSTWLIFGAEPGSWLFRVWTLTTAGERDAGASIFSALAVSFWLVDPGVGDIVRSPSDLCSDEFFVPPLNDDDG